MPISTSHRWGAVGQDDPRLLVHHILYDRLGNGATTMHKSDVLSFEVQPVNSEGSSTDCYMFGGPDRLRANAAYIQAVIAPADIEPVKHYAAYVQCYAQSFCKSEVSRYR